MSARVSSAVLAACVAVSGGCGSDGAIISARPEPFVYLVLNQPSGDASFPQRALLMTTGSPASSEYRVAETFVMRRVADGGLFQWTDLGQRGPVQGDPLNTALIWANYGLESVPAPGMLGTADIVAGEPYTLLIETMGATVSGAVTVPPSFSLTVGQESGTRVARWPRHVPGGMFSVELLGQTAPRFQEDTFWVVPPMTSSADLVVRALDANLSRYVRDEEATGAGLTGAFGVFGALTAASIRLEP